MVRSRNAGSGWQRLALALVLAATLASHAREARAQEASAPAASSQLAPSASAQLEADARRIADEKRAVDLRREEAKVQAQAPPTVRLARTGRVVVAHSVAGRDVVVLVVKHALMGRGRVHA